MKSLFTFTCAAVALLTAACSSQPSFEMEGTYEAEPPYSQGSVSQLRFTGPGYCSEITGDFRGNWTASILEGTCTLKKGGLEFAMSGPFGGVTHYYRIDGSNLVLDSQGVTLKKVGSR
jgi:hypothetical protein